jgi:DNA processing protein
MLAREPGQPLGPAEQLALFSPQGDVQAAARRLRHWEETGLVFLTPLDADYPTNLRRYPNPPPFLFVRGKLSRLDSRSLAIVGSRRCSEAGRRRATKLARAVAEAGVTVISGLALGIDSAAHRGALACPEGRTIAVVGTGLETVYPPENRPLQERILERDGVVISQFWPDYQGQRGGANFIARNRTMADLALATVVVEASVRSGARSQAVHAQKSGGTVLLLRSLVESQPWAKEMLGKPGCFLVNNVEDVLGYL